MQALLRQQGGAQALGRGAGGGEGLAVGSHERGRQRVGRLGQRQPHGVARLLGAEAEEPGGGHRAGQVVDVGPHLPVVGAGEHGRAEPPACLVGGHGSGQELGAGRAEHLAQGEGNQHRRMPGVAGK